MKRFLAIILVFLAVLVSTAWAEPTLYPDPIQAKTAKADVNIRADTNKKSKRLAQIKKAGTEITVLGEELDKDNALWYYVRTAKGTEGYVRSDMLEFDEPEQSEESMEAQNIWSPEDPEYWEFMREHYGIPEGFLDATISSSSASYTAGVPITITVTINGGVPPFAIRWSVNEPWYEDGHILDDYWRAGDYKECTGEYTTQSNESSFDIVMPLQGKDVYVMVDIQDGEKRISNIENYYITSVATGERAQTEAVDNRQAQFLMQTYASWSDAYYHFVVDKVYEQIGYPDYYLDNYEYVWMTDGSYKLEKRDYDDDPIHFSLFDLDGDGTPDLLGYNGEGSMAGNTYNVYTFRDGKIKYVGNLGERELMLRYDPERRYPGLVQSDGHMGSYYTEYWYMENNTIKCDLLETESYYSDPDADTPDFESDPVITRETENTDLYDWAKQSAGATLAIFSYNDVMNKGWEQVVETVYRAQPDSTDSVLVPTEETLSPAGTAGVAIGDQWQEIYLADLSTSEMATPEIYLFTISGTDLANMPVGNVLGRYTFRASTGPLDEIITISKPELPSALANRLNERQEAYLLYRMQSSRGSWSNMLIVFPQAENCGVTVGYNWFESRVHSVLGLGFSCRYWHLQWSDTYFSGMALHYPNTDDFSLAEDTEPSMNNAVTESYFPIPDSYLNLVLNYIR